MGNLADLFAFMVIECSITFSEVGPAELDDCKSGHLRADASVDAERTFRMSEAF